MEFSRRTDHDPTPNEFAEALAAARASGRSLVDLTESNPTRVGLPYDEAAILAALSPEAGLLRYDPEAFGMRAAREGVCADYLVQHGVDVSPDHLVLTSSTSEAYAYLFKLLCDPGDAVLVPAPSYPLIAHLAALEAVRVIPYPLVYDGSRFAIELDALRAARTPRTRAIVVVSPNNPTGNVLSQSERRGLATLDLPLVVDEVFLHYPHYSHYTEISARTAGEVGHARVRSALVDDDVLTFALSGLSKRALLPQAKLAWIAVRGPADRVKVAMGRLELIADTYLSPSAQVQRAAVRLMAATDSTVATLGERIVRNRDVLRATLGEESVLRAEGGWYAVLRVPSGQTDDGFAHAMLAAGVVVQPGWLYDFADEAHVVVSLIADFATFDEGVARLAYR